MFDVDGDECLVLNNFLVNLAEKLEKEKDVRPLYYEMGKADGKIINKDNIYNSIQFVYHKSNIGKVSNALTDLWNRDDPWSYYPIMQKLCAYNNDVIDSAKTLIVPKLPKEVSETIKNRGYVYFFQFAKDKKENECRKIGNTVMDNICKEIDNISDTKFDYSKGFGRFNVKTLLYSQSKFTINKDIINTYIKLEKETTDKINKYKAKFKNDDDVMVKANYKEMFYEQARKEILDYAKDNGFEYNFIVDNIIKYAFDKDIMRLAFIFEVFGAVIINNINNNLKNKSLDNGWKICERCGKRFKIKSKTYEAQYCEECAREIKKEKTKERVKKFRSKNK